MKEITVTSFKLEIIPICEFSNLVCNIFGVEKKKFVVIGEKALSVYKNNDLKNLLIAISTSTAVLSAENVVA